MNFKRLGATAAGVVAGAVVFFAPTAAMASDHSTPSSNTSCQQGQYSAGQLGLINLGNLGLSALNNPAIALGVLGSGTAVSDGSNAQVCGNTSR